MGDKSAASFPVSNPVEDSKAVRGSSLAATDTETVGAEAIEKRQPWRSIVEQEEFAQPKFFKERLAISGGNKIRLLEELDSKSR